MINTFIIPALARNQYPGLQVAQPITPIAQPIMPSVQPIVTSPQGPYSRIGQYGGAGSLGYTQPYQQQAFQQPSFAPASLDKSSKRNIFSSTYPEYFDRENPDALIPKDASVSWSEKRSNTVRM